MTGYEKGPQVALETLLALEDLPTKQVLHHEDTAYPAFPVDLRAVAS